MREGDCQATRALWERVFSEDSESFLDYYYTYKTAVNEIDTVVSSDGDSDAVIAMVHWNPYRVSVGGRLAQGERGCFRIPYIVGVATAPEHRHCGHMAALLRAGLRREAGRGTPFVWLIPADGAIYEPFDFRFAGERYCAVLPGIVSQPDGGGITVHTQGHQRQERQDFTQADDSGITVPSDAPDLGEIKICSVDDEIIPAVSDFLNGRLAGLFDIFARRDADYLKDARAQYASDGGGVAAICRGGRVEGYFSWWPEDEGITVRDLVLSRQLENAGLHSIEPPLRGWFLKELSATEMRAEAAALAAGVINVFTTGWCGEPLRATPVKNVMLRVANVRRFLELLRSDMEYRVLLRVRDTIIEENDGLFAWSVGPKGSTVEAVEKKSLISAHSGDNASKESAGKTLEEKSLVYARFVDNGPKESTVKAVEEKSSGDKTKDDTTKDKEALNRSFFKDIGCPAGACSGYLEMTAADLVEKLITERDIRIHLPECV